MFASSRVVDPAGRVTASSVRSRRRSSDSPSPRGIVASMRALACTSGRSMTASTRLARRPGATCPAGVCSDARTVPSAPALVVTSAAAAGWPSSPTSMCRGRSGSVMAGASWDRSLGPASGTRPNLPRLGLPGPETQPLHCRRSCYVPAPAVQAKTNLTTTVPRELSPSPRACPSRAGDRGKESTLPHFQSIAHPGACGKTRVVPQNSWPRPEPTEMGSLSACVVVGDGVTGDVEPTAGADNVNSLTTSAFNLPDRLAAKADPALIGGDEEHFAAIAASLEQSIADLSGRLEAELKAPGGTGQKAMDRDVEIHRLTARLRVLSRFGLDLCLGHIVSAESISGHPEPVYIGRLGLTDSAGRRLLLDWRSPAAEPFFGATHANPMGLASRRRYRWTRGRVSDYWDEVFTADGLEGHAALDDQSAFIASLGSSRSARMRDVLGTIAADQDAIIRAGSRGALVVDGGPGTGKTVVALHRCAYLLYADPRLGHRQGGVLFVGPHQPYLAYVSDVLPSLGEEGVQTCTLRDLVPEGAAATPETDPEVARLKSSAAMVEAIEPAVRFYENPPAEGMKVETHWSDIWLSAGDWAEAFEAPDPGTPHIEAREQIWQEVLGILADKYDGDAPADLLRKSLLQNRELYTALNRAWPLIEAADLVSDLWSVPAYLRLCAPWLSPDDVAKLQRGDAQAWTVSDLPFLDAARQRLG